MMDAGCIDRVLDLSAAWKAAAEVFPYFEERGIDWDSVYGEYLPLVLSASSEREFNLLMSEFLNRLGDGHTDYRFPDKLIRETGFLPFHLCYLEKEWYLMEVPAGRGEFLLAKITGVNGEKVSDFLERCLRYIYHIGNYANPGKLEEIMPFLLLKEGNELETSCGIFRFDLVPEMPELVGVKKISQRSDYSGGGALSDSTKGLEKDIKYQKISDKKISFCVYDSNVLYIRMDSFLYSGVAEEISSVLSDFHSISGVILDVRKNIGGMTVYAAEVAELFIPGEFSGSMKKTRQMKGIDLSSGSQYAKMGDERINRSIKEGFCNAEEINRCLRTYKNMYYHEYRDSFGKPGQQEMFKGKVILLTSRETISAAEDFTAMFKSTHRALIIGSPTFGSTGTPFLKRLRLGGSFRICSVGYRLLDGTEFIGRGIMPDILLEESAEDFANGRDVVLDRALKEILV